MNEKQAREIVPQFKDAQYIWEGVHPNAKAYFIAEGYLEALDKAKGLEDFIDGLDCECDTMTEYRCARCKTLAKYHSVK